MSERILSYLLVCAVLTITPAACVAPQPAAPASFSVLTLNVSPQKVQPGQEVTLTAEVANTGGMPGNFDEPLIVNGKKDELRVITIQPGYSKSLTYKVVRNQSGQYTVQLGTRSTSFTVSGMVEQAVELKYDNDRPRDALWAGNNGGFLICFNPPQKPFSLNRVRICGGTYGVGWEGKSFNLMVLDSDMKSIISDEAYVVEKFPVKSAYPYAPPVWVDFNVPAATLENKFYVYLYTGLTGMGKHRGVHVGVDDSNVNEHSYLAQGRPPYVAIVEPVSQYPAGIWYADITKLNWMIRAYGTAMVPE